MFDSLFGWHKPQHPHRHRLFPNQYVGRHMQDIHMKYTITKHNFPVSIHFTIFVCNHFQNWKLNYKACPYESFNMPVVASCQPPVAPGSDKVRTYIQACNCKFRVPNLAKFLNFELAHQTIEVAMPFTQMSRVYQRSHLQDIYYKTCIAVMRLWAGRIGGYRIHYTNLTEVLYNFTFTTLITNY